MTQTRSLLWKEWYEVRLLAAVGLFVFLGLPLIGAVEDLIVRHRFELEASLWVYLLGGVLAVVVGVGTVVRDLNGRLEEFWRSRPVSVTRWLVIKCFVGLAAVLAALVIPLVLEISLNRKPSEMGPNPPGLILLWSPFLWAALYSIAFAIACVVRRGAHAAMLSIAALLLLYFLPEVLPPLHFLSIGWVTDESRFPGAGRRLPGPVSYPQFEFVFGMIALSVLALVIAVLAVRRDWRVESGRKMMYWSIGGALLVLFSSAAFQVQTNLPLLQTIDLSKRMWNYPIRSDGTNGWMLSQQWGPDDRLSRVILRTLSVTASGVQLGPEAGIDTKLGWRLIWNPRHPTVLYAPGPADRTDSNVATLTVIDLGAHSPKTQVRSYPQVEESPDPNVPSWIGTSFVWNDRLYMSGRRLVTFDLSDPLQPRLVSVQTVPPTHVKKDLTAWALLADPAADVVEATVPLPLVPDLPPRQRLEMEAASWRPDFGRGAMLTGDILVRLYTDHITTYRLEQLTEESATFRQAGRYEHTPIQRMLGDSVRDAAVGGGLLFESLSGGVLGGAHLAVFDVSGGRPKPVGHFSLPQEPELNSLCPLPDGRLLASGPARLYLLGPPPGRGPW